MYCCHVSFYLSMKAEGRKNTQQHPVMKTMLHLRQTLKQLEPMEAHFEHADGEDGEEEDGELEDGEEEELDDEEQQDEEGEEGEDDEEMADDGEDFDEDDELDLPAVDPSNLAHSDLMSRQSAQLERLLAGVGQASNNKRASKSVVASSRARSALSDFGEVDHKAEMARNVTSQSRCSRVHTAGCWEGGECAVDFVRLLILVFCCVSCWCVFVCPLV